MSGREKLLLVWAVVIIGFGVIAGLIVVQMILPRVAEAAIVTSAQELAVGEKLVYECNRTTAQCMPTQGSGSHYSDYANAIRNGSLENYAVIWVTRETPTEWRAFSAASTHLGCFVNWNAERKLWMDPCSGARWLEDGKYQEGPAPRNLDWYPVRVNGGDVWIDFKLMRGDTHG